MFHKLAAAALALTLALPGLLLAATPININQANAATIAKSLDGIGQSKAEAIVAWREANGPFKKADDLRHVKGIGKATIERNRSAILLADEAAATSPRRMRRPSPVPRAASPSPRNRSAAIAKPGDAAATSRAARVCTTPGHADRHSLRYTRALSQFAAMP